MARIRFNEGERIIGTVIAIALLAALLVAACVYWWEYHQRKINGTDRNEPSTELRVPLSTPINLRA
ncbi:MAG: hypothetical protein ACJ71N_06260 [Terriglobales bacterium]|jgi:hypothetical protein